MASFRLGVMQAGLLLQASLIVEAGEATRIERITAQIKSAAVHDTRVGNLAARLANGFLAPSMAQAGPHRGCGMMLWRFSSTGRGQQPLDRRAVGSVPDHERIERTAICC